MNTATESIRSMRTSDKLVGGILLAIVGSVAGYGLFHILPFLVEMAQNTIYFMFELGVICILGMIMLDKNFWLSLYVGWQNVSRRTRRLIVSYDPVGTLDTVIGMFEKKLREIVELITNGIAALKRQDRAIANAREQGVNERALAEQARKEKKELQVGQHALAAERWDKSAEKMIPMRDTLANALVAMNRGKDLCVARLDDNRTQRTILAQELDIARTGSKIMSRIGQFLGHSPELELQEMAVEDIQRESSESLAQLDMFIRNITPALDAQDLQTAADQSIALDKFNKFLSGAEQRTSLPEAKTPVMQIPVSVPEREKATVVKSQTTNNR